MDAPKYTGLEHYFDILQKSSLKNISCIIKCSDYRVVKAIVEVLLNILKGVVPISDKQVTKFKILKPVIHKLVSTKTSLDRKKQILSEHSDLVKLTSKVLIDYLK